jgi:hypothetical protein
MKEDTKNDIIWLILTFLFLIIFFMITILNKG